MIKLRAIALLTATLSLSACEQKPQAPLPKDSSPEISQLQESVKGLEKRVSKVQGETFGLKFRLDQYQTAGFDPAEGKGYERVETTSGTFLISLQEVSPYLDGVKVKLHIGNIQFATYNGFELAAEYGQRYPAFDGKLTPEEYNKRYEVADATTRKKSETFTEVLRPGTWNVVHMALPEVKPEAFGRLAISMKTNQVMLNGGR